jgi:outer membrane protein TolC
MKEVSGTGPESLKREQVVLTNDRAYLRSIAVTLVRSAPTGLTALAQSSAGGEVLTLGEAVVFAFKNYPAVRASREQIAAAQRGIGLAQTNYLPRARSGRRGF